ncbi:MAG: DegT/DnrJ/EryC1/StrS family aminotransferase [Cyclobacteriaceae bacterium]|nr:DegT/DnrJ/EryC1/StrS family aminotransferase [Cyclobacteriaceae bacterium]
MPGMEVFGAEERKEALDVLETGALFRYGHEDLRKGMWKSKEFEEEVCKFTGAGYAHAVTSGSTAVATMMAAAGVGHGDEVVVPPFTFVAPVEGVFLGGALPLFGEIDETLCLSPEGIEKAITPNTKAVLLVHMCGAAADLEGILKVCRKHGLILLEDCGQAMGAFYRGKSVGLYGKAGSFSFDYFKIVTCGEGGIVITDDRSLYHKMDQISDHGHTHTGNNRGMENHHLIGFNYRISELSAAIGLAQMRKLPGILEDNKKNKNYLKERLKEIQDLQFRKLTDEDGDSATFLNFFLPSKPIAEKVFDQLKKDGVGGVTYWYTNMYHFINQWDHIKNLSYPAPLSIHALGAPQDYHQIELPRSEDLMSRMGSIGIRCTWTENETEQFADKLVGAIRKVL